MRVGMGYDVHKLVEGRDLILGGVKIPYEKGLLGHSDADVLLHAIMDALLGAAALGDIGQHFPDTDPAYKGASSIRLLEEVGRMIDEKLYVIGNIDATIIAQRPKMAPHIEQMRKNVAEALHIEVDQVNIKATTEEGLGFTGTGEGISSQAIASLDTIANYSYRVGPSEGGCAGCGGCMKELLRTRVERFGLEDSIRLGEIAQLQKEGILEEKIIAIDEMFPTYAQVVLPPKTAAAVRNGNSFRKRDISQETALKEYENDERVRVYDESHQFIAIYCYCRKDDLFKIVKMFFDGNEKK